ncbi:conserved hypothetical protein [Frankia alni ACN14a]|uniref:AAA+ ATPase domain-containing protein n=2 Tax=Frankiaceae TaxID=74712 RepID=Q0RU25_FRAAA|nr:conserved hypothetical protein [Frankia alni ACN14a]
MVDDHRAGGADGARRPDAPPWWLFRGTGEPVDGKLPWPPAPAWRRFPAPAHEGAAPPGDDDAIARHRRAIAALLLGPEQIAAVNVGLLLRRPLLVTGPPGMGGAGLAQLIARELRLGRVLRWTVNSRTTLREGIYDYDVLGVAHSALLERPTEPAGEAGGLSGPRGSVGDHLADRPAAGSPPVPRHIRLGPLATALLPRVRPRVLLVDRFDRCGHDLPDDLLDVIEEGRVVVPELARLPSADGPFRVAVDDPGGHAEVGDGVVACAEFPVMVITSNGERDFSPAFRRRCVAVQLPEPSRDELEALVAAEFGADSRAAALVERFENSRGAGAELTVDHLFDALHLASAGVLDEDAARTLDAVWGRESAGSARRLPGRLL